MRGLKVDAAALSAQLGLPVVRTVAIHKEGLDDLRALLDKPEVWEGRAIAPAAENRKAQRKKRKLEKMLSYWQSVRAEKNAA